MSIAIRQLKVPRHHRMIFQGQNVNIIAEIADVGLLSTLLDPGSVPLLSLFDPVGTLLVNNVDMSRLSVGIYNYIYQTTSTNIVGLYTVTMKAIDGLDVARLERIVVFRILALSNFPAQEIFTYFAIKDQSGEIWYWYIAVDNTLNSVASIPVIPGRIATVFVITPIPYWLRLDNPSAQVRYVYPSLAGEPIVTDVQPTIGTGYTGSPTMTSGSSGVFTIDVNVAEEVFLQS